ncbi:hypothetical protein HU200_009779 [Digitaria exilis]|uniref:Pectinesterase n=1 Tax=Digitaria exilis TaxID=1010633 RepID=A0A835FL37_9POAL|nr:hypothetical protein HU200_009779 [Digitaria exilis]
MSLYTHDASHKLANTCELHASSSTMASSTMSAAFLLLLTSVLLGAARHVGAAAVFAGVSFETQGEAEAFEDALLRQACFNVSASGARLGEEACVSRLDTARGGAGSGPVPVLRAALRDTLGEAVGAVVSVRALASLSNHARDEMAVRDCVELLGYSVDELGWALDAMAETDDEQDDASGSRRAEDDLHAWLSAAMGNQDTCVEGFHGTDGLLLRRVEVAVAQLTQLVSNLLAMHKRLRSITPLLHHGDPARNNGTGLGSELPPWVTDIEDGDDKGDEELLQRCGRGRAGGGKPRTRVDVVVAQDGSGRYRTVGEAVARAPSHSKRKYVIYVKRGVYHENVEVRKKKTNLVIVGEGMGETVISASRSFSGGWTTFRSATFGKVHTFPALLAIDQIDAFKSQLLGYVTTQKARGGRVIAMHLLGPCHGVHLCFAFANAAVSGTGFVARDLTIRNTAGPAAHQAVALRVDSDRSAFFRVAVEGYQDTLYAHSLRQFYRDCHVSGTVDFVFGNGAVVLQRTLVATLPMAAGQVGSVTAQGRRDPNQGTGFAFHGCVVEARHPTFLGRPWKPFSRVVVMESYLGPGVQARRWLEWAATGEYRNYGPGAGVAGRVKWPGYHVIMDAAVASRFTVRRFLDGLAWLPGTGVTFTADLFRK